MATRRKTTRKKTTRRAPARRTTTAKAPVRRRRRKSGLGEMFSKASTTGAVKAMAAGAMVGGSVGWLEKKVFHSLNPLAKTAALMGLSFVAGAGLKQPNISAAMAATALYSLVEKPAGVAMAMGLDYEEAEYVDLTSMMPILNEAYQLEDPYQLEDSYQLESEFDFDGF